MKIHHLQDPLSQNTDDHLIKKYTTFNTKISHIQEHQSFTIFECEKPTSYKLGLDVGTRDFCQQYSVTQHIVTPLYNLVNEKAQHRCVFSQRNTNPSPSLNGENKTTGK
jgi:hypothetical protein